MATPITTEANLDVAPLSGSLGAEIRGISLDQAGPAEAELIRSLLIENLVLFFPDQHLSQESHIAFGRHFGKLEGRRLGGIGGCLRYPQSFRRAVIEDKRGIR